MKLCWGGTFIDSGTMAEMTKVAHAKIWSQMDGIVAVTGVGGWKTSAFHNVADDCIQSAQVDKGTLVAECAGAAH